LQGISAVPSSIDLAGTVVINVKAIDPADDINQITVVIDNPGTGLDKLVSAFTYNSTSELWVSDNVSFANNDPAGDWIITTITLFDSINNQRVYYINSALFATTYAYLDGGSPENSNVNILSINKARDK